MASGPPDPWELVGEAARAIGARTGVARHDVAVVLGSGWGPAAERTPCTTAVGSWPS